MSLELTTNPIGDLRMLNPPEDNTLNGYEFDFFTACYVGAIANVDIHASGTVSGEEYYLRAASRHDTRIHAAIYQEPYEDDQYIYAYRRDIDLESLPDILREFTAMEFGDILANTLDDNEPDDLLLERKGNTWNADYPDVEVSGAISTYVGVNAVEYIDNKEAGRDLIEPAGYFGETVNPENPSAETFAHYEVRHLDNHSIVYENVSDGETMYRVVPRPIGETVIEFFEDCIYIQ